MLPAGHAQEPEVDQVLHEGMSPSVPARGGTAESSAHAFHPRPVPKGPVVEEVVDIDEQSIRRRKLEESNSDVGHGKPAPLREVREVYPSRYRRHEPKLSDFHKKKFQVLRYEFAMGWYLVRAFINLVSRGLTLFTIAFGVGSVLVCYYFQLSSDIPLNIIGSAMLFPVSFSIPYILGRRENALHDLADLKASAVSIYLATREWAPTDHKREMSKKVKRVLKELLHNIAKFVAHKKEDLGVIYRSFDDLFVALEELRSSDRWIQSVISRCYQYARFMMNDFERLRILHDFKLPSAFRAFTLIFLTLGPLFMGPIFGHVSQIYGLWAGIYASILTSLLLITLYHIIHDNEDPFDNLGWDDLNFHLIEEAPLHICNTRQCEEEQPQLHI
jgi:hypothetical protein